MTTTSRGAVLWIDPDRDTAAAAASLLEGEDYPVVPSSTLKDALAKLHESGFSLIVTDCVFPTPSKAWEDFEQIKALAGTAVVGICTAWPTDEAEAKQHGAAFLLQKPFNIDRLLGLISDVTEGQSRIDLYEPVIKAYFEALTRKDWDRFASLCTEDVRYEVPGENPRYSRTVKGRANFRQFSEETFKAFPDARFEVESIHPLPSGALARYRSSFNAPPQEIRGAVLFRIRDDKIERVDVRLPLSSLDQVARPS